MKFNKLLVFGFVMLSNNIEANEIVNIPKMTNINEGKIIVKNTTPLYNETSKLIPNVNKYQQIQEHNTNTVLNYLYPILKVFVSNNYINNKSQDIQKLQDYINVMSGVV